MHIVNVRIEGKGVFFSVYPFQTVTGEKRKIQTNRAKTMFEFMSSAMYARNI